MGNYKLRFTLADGSIIDTDPFTIVNGNNGTNGANGNDGVDGTNGADGISIISGSVNIDGELVLIKSDLSTINVGVVKGATGANGQAFQVNSTGDVSTDSGYLLLDNNSGKIPSVIEPYFHVVMTDNRTASDNPNVYLIGTTTKVENLAGHLIMTVNDSEPKTYYSYGVFTGVAGQQGQKGDTGDKGWSPIFQVVIKSATEEVLKFKQWTGGAGLPPISPIEPNTYLGTSGYTSITNAVNIRGTNGANGVDGVNGTNGTNGTDGVNGSDGANGSDGREVELQKSSTYIQWRYVGDIVWNDLVLLSDLKGDKGDIGQGCYLFYNNISVSYMSSDTYSDKFIINGGLDGTSITNIVYKGNTDTYYITWTLYININGVDTLVGILPDYPNSGYFYGSFDCNIPLTYLDIVRLHFVPTSIGIVLGSYTFDAITVTIS